MEASNQKRDQFLTATDRQHRLTRDGEKKDRQRLPASRTGLILPRLRRERPKRDANRRGLAPQPAASKNLKPTLDPDDELPRVPDPLNESDADATVTATPFRNSIDTLASREIVGQPAKVEGDFWPKQDSPPPLADDLRSERSRLIDK